MRKPRWMIAVGILGCAGCAGAPHDSKREVTVPVVPASTIADASVEATVLPVTHSEIADVDAVTMNLAAVGGQHPAVGLARWRVQEAYAQLEQAQVLWLPSIQSGYSFHRHDGN